MRTPSTTPSTMRCAAVSHNVLRLEPLEPRLLLTGDVVISEFMALNNSGALKDQDGQASDWIEINNVSASPVNLNGWGLTDKQDQPFEWRFPAVTIPAGGYLVVFASGKDRAVAGSQLHTNFQLDGAGEYLGLVRPDGTVAQEYAPVFPQQEADVSYGLVPNWQQPGQYIYRYFTVPTPGAANGSASADQGPIITNVAQSPLRPADNDNITVTADIQQAFSPVTTVTMKYRVMFGSEVTLTMYDDGLHGDGAAGDGKFGSAIPASASTPGQMVRWYISASAGANNSRWPLYTQPTNSEQYLGTVIQDTSYAATQLPVFQFFVLSTTAADSRAGTRGDVFYLGELYDNVFIRVRGGTINAGMPVGAGLSRKVNFNDDHRFLWDPSLPRVNQINLNDPGPQDDSYLRQELSFWLYDQAGQPGETTFLMHVRQNGSYMGVRIFHEQADEDMLNREGLDPNGALYQSVGSRVDNLSFKKKTRTWEGTDDMQALVNGVDPNNPNRHRYVMDNLDLAALVNYLAVDAIIEDSDCIQGNYMLYRDSDGSGEWMYVPRDRDLTFGDWVDAGQDWGLNGNGGDRYITNPNYGSSTYPHLSRGWNRLTDAIHDDPVAEEMFYRRLRTLMDEFLKPPGTAYAQLPIEAEIDSLVSDLSYESAHNMLPPQDTSPGNNFAHGINELKNFYLAGRRGYLYSGTIPNTPIPSAQAAIFAGQVVISGMDASPASGNQDEEYVKLTNPNSYAVDISGWSLAGGIDYTFPPGTVLVAGGSMYVTPNAKAFRARTTGVSGGQGLFVQGGYAGHLDGDGENIFLLGPANQTISSAAVTPDSMVINEVLAHSTSKDPLGDWVELYNPTSAPIAIGGWYLSDDPITPMKYQIPAGIVIAAGEYKVFNERDNFGSLFAFSKNGDQVVLTAADGTTIDEQDFGATASEVTLGRYTNSIGKVDFVMLAGPTMGAANAAPLVGPVVINEIMYHPLDGKDEFIELYNPTSAAVPLYDSAAPTHTWEISSGVNFTFPAGLSIPAGGYLVVTAADVSTPEGMASFRTEYNVPSQTQVLGPYSGQLDNAGESVVLSQPGNLDVGTGTFAYIDEDSVEYNDTYPWPTAADGSGASLERLTALAYGNDPANWRSIRSAGTPGRPSPLKGDANDDGTVDVVDLGILARNYDKTSGCTWFTADFNNDGVVDVIDLGILAANYDKSVTPPAGGLDETIASPIVPAALMIVSPVDDHKAAIAAQAPAADAGALVVGDADSGTTVDQQGPAPAVLRADRVALPSDAQADILAPSSTAPLGDQPLVASVAVRWQAPWRARTGVLPSDFDGIDLLGQQTQDLLRSAGRPAHRQGRRA